MNSKTFTLILLFNFFLPNVYSQDILNGFKILTIPRKSVPLGAEWINGVGVNGDGVGDNNIRVSESVDGGQINKNFADSLNVSLLNYFGIGANYKKTLRFNFGKLSIYTVKDFGKTNLNTGQYILYEYLKSDTVYLDYDKSIKTTIEASISKKVNNLKISNGLNGSKKIVFSGRDLVFAYRIFSFGKTNKREKTVKIKDTKNGGGFREVKVFDYDIRFNDEALQRCLEQAGRKIPMDLSQFHICEKSTPIEIYVRNFNNTSIGGKPMSKNFETLANTSKEFYFTYKKDGKVVTDDITIDYVYREGENIFYLSMDDFLSKITIRTMETKMTMLNNPHAAGW